MRYVRKTLQVLLTLALFAGAGYVIYWVGDQLLTGLLQLDRQVAVAVIGAAGTVIAVIWNQRSLKKREIAEAHRPQKVEVYSEFMEKLIAKTLKRSGDEELTEEWIKRELQDFFYDWTGKLIVWGSPGFIKAYQRFRHLSIQEDPNVLVTLDKMMQEIRKDLGHSRDWRTLSDGDLIGLYLTDPENLHKLSEAE